MSAVSMAQAAEALGVSARTLGRWRKRGMPVRAGAPGAPVLVNVAAVRAWARRQGLTGHMGRPLGAPPPPAAPDPAPALAGVELGAPDDLLDLDALPVALQRAEVRRREADAARRELALARERGQVVDVEDVRRALVARAAAYRSGLEALPTRVADRLAGLAPDAIERLLEAEVEQVLERVVAIDLASVATG